MVEDHRRTVICLLSFVVIITVVLCLNTMLVPNFKVYFTCFFKKTSESIVRKTFNQDQNKMVKKQSIVRKIFNQDQNKMVKKVEIERYEWEIDDGIDKHKVSNIRMQCANIRNEDRFDCYPEGEITQEACVNRQCCWKPAITDKINKSVDLLPPLNVPWCYYPKDYLGFKTNKVYNTDIGFNADLSRTTQSHYPETIMNLTMEVRYETQTRLRIKVI